MAEVYFRFKEESTEVTGTAIKAIAERGEIIRLQDITACDRELMFNRVKGNLYQIVSPQGQYCAQATCPPLFVETAPRINYEVDFSPEQPRVLSSSDGTPGFLEVITQKEAEKMVQDATNFALLRAWIC